MTVAVTGGAGSLGKAFCRHLVAQGLEVMAVDNNEWAVAAFQSEGVCPVILTDFTDYPYTEDFVIHCAAYKHVNLGEESVAAFVDNNVTKTALLFKRLQGKQFLFVSTDKAVEPISYYGYSKALGEGLAWQYGGQVARLGNVLHSHGSVIPVWEEQIAKKQPLTITDWEMRRYVISEERAVSEVWAGFKLGKRLIIPRMDREVTVRELVEEVLQRHGYRTVSDYSPGYRVTGARAGEKQREQLRWPSEEGAGHR